jgi:hypothetical protein
MDGVERPIETTCSESAPRGSFTAALEGFFVKRREGFIYFHFLMFALFVAVIVAPAFLPHPPEDAGIIDNFTLLSSYILWGLWFPLVFLSVIVFGRLWCGLLCPQGALSEYVSRWGSNRAVPKWMRWGPVPVLSFVVITVFGQLVGVRDYPGPAVVVFVGTTLIAVLVGVIYVRGRRVWCRFLCPMGPLLGVLSRIGAVSFESDRTTGMGYPCPTLINTSSKTASTHCIECFKCVNPGSQGSLNLVIRRPGTEVEEIGGREASLSEVLFLFAAAGLALGTFHWQSSPLFIDLKFALGGFFLDHGLADFIGGSGPWWIMVNYPHAGEVFNWLDFISISAFTLGCMAFVASGLFLLAALSALILRLKGRGEREGFLQTVTRLGYIYAPVALVSLVVGLGAVLFQSIGAAAGLAPGAVKALQWGVFLAGSLWSLVLAVKLGGRPGAALVPCIAGIGFVAYLWGSVIF